MTDAQCKKYLPLNNNTAITVPLKDQRRNDHIGHFVLRLAFCRSCVDVVSLMVSSSSIAREELRRRFVKAETTLFRVRYEMDDLGERSAFLDQQRFEWEEVSRPVPAPILPLKHRV